MATIYKRPKQNNWSVEWTDSEGKRVQRSTGTPNRRLAKYIAKDIMSNHDAPWDQLTIDDVQGMYQHEPVINDWHIGYIQFSGTQLEWHNTAGKQWNLEADLVNGQLLTGPDCPYYGQYGDMFQVVLQRDPMGDLTKEVRGFEFGSLYELQP